ncbi:hypothetical protein AMELA_G00280830 [Ameiurus melas]|uniref:Centromere protein J n=1 Tax=Ameiurus melas TaxID=219545 RepID=A0A7J5ZNA7_AMEME|nr:hypothetical protein AMELA_G00280830 [Ameiurus melas]
MSVKTPPPGRCAAGADPERNPEATGAPVSEEKIQQQLPAAAQSRPPCDVLQGALHSHLNQHGYQLPHSPSASREQLLQMQVKQLQKALHEQKALLNFLSPGLMLSPAFLTQYQAYSLSQRPETDADGVLDSGKCVSNTLIIRAGVEQEVSACAPQRTQCTDHTTLQAVSTEQRCLSPIKEESCGPGEEPCTVSPFGVRRKVPANPEERPIRPGLKETEKTFDDFVEEQLKLDKELLKKDKQLRTAEKKNFLRKGDGRSRISQIKDNIQKIQPASKITTSTQLQRPSTASAVQHSDKIRWTGSSPHIQQSSSLGRQNLLLIRKGKAKCSGQRSGQENLPRNIHPAHECTFLALDHIKHSSQKNDDCPKQPNQIRSTMLQDGYIMLSGRKDAPKIHLLEERVGFKKVNDRIVRVCDLEEASTKALSLTTEIKQLLLHSSSGDSTAAEDDPKPPTPPNPLRINSDQNLDLSDEDYASDAPSDISPSECPQAPHFFHELSSSSGSDESDSELQQLCWSEPLRPSRTPKETSGANSLDLLARIFPQVKSTGKNEMNNDLWEKTQHSMNGGEPVKKVPENSGSDIRDGTSNGLMMDKMKTEQDKALNFLRSEMERFSNNDKDSVKNSRSSDHTAQDVTQHLNEAEDFRQQIQYLQKQLKRRECEWWQAHSELQSRVDALTRENKALMSQCDVQVRPQSSGRATPHPDARNLTRTRSVTSSQEKNKLNISSTRRGSSNSRTSTASQSPDDGDTIPYSEYGQKGSCSSAEKQNGVGRRNSVPKGLQSTLKPGKSVSSESDYGSTDMTEDSLNPEMKNTSTQGATKAVVREETRYPDGKVEQLLSDGSRVIVFRNGTRKEIGADQKSTTVTFCNGDVKRVLADGTMVYYYCDTQTTHSTYPSGLEVLQFPNKQREKRHPDGTREILFPDGTVKTLYPDGRQQSFFPDGTVVKLSKTGEKTVEFTNGQREVHTSQYKQRIYPDGTVKTVYLNGRQETKYSSGRIRIKNNEDVIMMDRK